MSQHWYWQGAVQHHNPYIGVTTQQPTVAGVYLSLVYKLCAGGWIKPPLLSYTDRRIMDIYSKQWLTPNVRLPQEA
jgi:hypothetical protein